MFLQDFHGNVNVVPRSGFIVYSWGLLLLYRDLFRRYRRHSPWLPRSYVPSFPVRGYLLIILLSHEFSGVGIEEYRLWEYQNGLFTDLHHVSGIRSSNWF